MKPRAILLALFCASITVFTVYCVLRVPVVTHDYGLYYTTARMVVEGDDLALAYLPDSLNVRVFRNGIHQPDFSINPPTNALTLVPFAVTDVYTARIAWSCCSILMLMAALWMLLRINGVAWNTNVGFGVLALAFMWRPIYDNVAWGQLYFLLLLLFVMSLRGMQTRRPWLTGVPIAFALVIKGYGVIPLLWLIMMRRWKELWIAVGSACAMIVLTLPVVGVATWVAYYNIALAQLGRLPWYAAVALQTINGFIRHLFLYDPTFSPHPLMVVDESILYYIIIAVNAALVVAVLLRLRRHRVDEIAGYTTAIAVGVVTAPFAGEYHFVLFLPLVFAWLSRALRNRLKLFTTRNLLIGCAVLILAVPLKNTMFEDASVPLVLLAYVKLYAAVVVVWMAGAKARASAHMQAQ